MPEATTTSGANAAGPRWTPHCGLFLWSQRVGDAGQRLSVSGALDKLHRLSLRAPAPTVVRAKKERGQRLRSRRIDAEDGTALAVDSAEDRRGEEALGRE